MRKMTEATVLDKEADLITTIELVKANKILTLKKMKDGEIPTELSAEDRDYNIELAVNDLAKYQWRREEGLLQMNEAGNGLLARKKYPVSGILGVELNMDEEIHEMQIRAPRIKSIYGLN
ncbi:MAG: hypothetical protein JWM96_234 [Alphaproteobacteria bacterium]|nr:hypothetical protein [Alphaproteobacteria bacterium]